MSWRQVEFNDCASLPLGVADFITVAHGRLFVFGADKINFLGSAVWSMPADGGTLQQTGGAPGLTNFGMYCQGHSEIDVIIAGGAGNDPDFAASNDLFVVRCLQSGEVQVIATHKIPAAIELGGFLLHNGYLYLMGGYDQTAAAYNTKCWRAKVDSKYSFGPWESLPDLPRTVVSATNRGIAQQGLVGVGDYIYSVGGGQLCRQLRSGIQGLRSSCG